MSYNSGGTFARQLRTGRPLRVRERDVIAAESFQNITIAEVRMTGGQGSFKVRKYGNTSDNDLVTVRQLTPHASYKPPTAGGDDVNNFEDTQTASGMAVPTPQIGTLGIIITANNDATTGYWIGSIMPPGVGHTIPEPARTEYTTGEQGDLDDLASPVGLPGSEMNPSAYDGRVPETRARRAVHPFARVLQRQGLLVDTVRGSGTSSIMRDADSRMIGFNTPGGLGTSQDLISSPERAGNQNLNPLRLTRLGGHTFTMDDGDDRGQNNLVRIRSSKVAQILFHDSEDLVYIANQNGTAWIEMTSDGKIDIYAKDSVSIHSEADFNFRADRDINFEAGRNLNIKGTERLHLEGNALRVLGKIDTVVESRGSLDITGGQTRFSGNDVSINSDNLNLATKLNTEIRSGELDLVTQFGMRTSHGTGLEIKTNVIENQIWNKQTYNPGKTYYKDNTVVFGTQFFKALKQTIAPNTPGVPIPPAPGPYWTIMPPVVPQTVHGDFKVDTNVAGPLPGQIQLFSKDAVKITASEGTIDLLALTKNINLQTPQTIYIDGSSAVHLNLPGPGATPATPIPVSALATNIPIPFDTSAETPGNMPELGVFENPNSDLSRPWNEAYYASDDPLFSIMLRVPQHEPWPNHESSDKSQTSSGATDRETAGR